MTATPVTAGIGMQDRGNITPILHEVAHALERLLETSEPTIIDLNSLPFGPGELERLEDRLGKGELNAELDALGRSVIRETAYPGVWWLEHRNANDEVVGRYVEITRTPEILKSQDIDIQSGRARLVADLDTGGEEATTTEAEQ